MIDLGLNQYKVKEIRYEVKEGKTVIFKLNNFNLEDVEIEEEIKEEKEEEPKFSVKDLDKYGPAKHLDDYKPISCFKDDEGMQKTLESSRKKEWKEDVITKPSKPTPTGNALIKEDNSELKELITGYKNKKNYTQSNLAEPEEIKVFNINQKISDSKYIEEENKE